jgi:hypothetical protein
MYLGLATSSLPEGSSVLCLILQPQKITVCYWKDKHGRSDFNIDNFPTFTMNGAAGKHHIYGLPAHEYPGLVKVSYHIYSLDLLDKRSYFSNFIFCSIFKNSISSHFKDCF